ncbi:DUF7546 family protein [Halostella litorea]|uniref:DUF7546 family protein n=1 Tax=Halostella litorea TaxID=2528831 RepID=UPI001092B8D5|nr:hypothetical protein [Halostella litorea]
MPATLGPADDPSLGSRARTARALVVLTAAEALVVAAYFAATDARVLSARYLAYPFVWMNVAVLAVARTRRPGVSDRRTGAAAVVAAGYFLLLAWAGGLVAPGSGAGVGDAVVHAAPPGWGPILLVTGGWVSLTLVPFKAVGYAGLAALVYAMLADASRSAASGLLGFVTCVSCTGSVLGTLLAGTVGGSVAAASALFVQSYDVSTAVFLLTVAALWAGLRR